MDKLENKDLIKEFYDNYKNDYPDLDINDFKDICTSPWQFISKIMQSGELDSIRLKYFGIFQVLKGRAKNMLNNLDKKLENKQINNKQYNQYKSILTKYLKNNE